METVCILLRAPRRHIGLLCGLIEGYEGVAVLRTVDPVQGLLELLVAPAFHSTALAVVHALTHDLDLCLIDAGDVPTASAGP